MTANDAYEVIKKANPKMSVVECLEFPEFYAFALVPKGKEGEPIGGGYDTVDKRTGELGAFNPIEDFGAFRAAKKICL